MTTPRHLLIVEDDETFARTLRRSFERRGYAVSSAHSHDGLMALLGEGLVPTHAVIDLKLAGSASGLTCVPAVRAAAPDARIVVLTGFASIATAVDPTPPVAPVTRIGPSPGVMP